MYTRQIKRVVEQIEAKGLPYPTGAQLGHLVAELAELELEHFAFERRPELQAKLDALYDTYKGVPYEFVDQLDPLGGTHQP